MTFKEGEHQALRDGVFARALSGEPSLPSRKPDDVSNLRWHAASAVYKLKSLKLGSRTPNNTSDSLSPRKHSSYLISALPHAVTNGGQFRYVRLFTPFLANSLFFNHLASSGDDKWTLLKATLLADGYRVALLHAVVAILVNHIRQTFVPWLGSFWFYHPMEDLRLARSNPDVFLEQTLSYHWRDVLFSFVQRAALDTCAHLITAALLGIKGGSPQSASDAVRTSATAAAVTLRGLVHLGKIGFGVYMLMTLDYIFCLSVHTVSCIIATYKLATGTKTDLLVLEQLAEKYTVAATVTAWMIYSYLWKAFWPMIVHALMSAARGRPLLLVALLSVVGGVWAMLRYRARLYILLEMTPMFVVLGLLVLAVMLLCVEFVNDPLGLGPVRTR